SEDGSYELTRDALDGLSMAADVSYEIAALHQLHDEIGDVVVGIHVEQTHEVPMPESAHEAVLPLERTKLDSPPVEDDLDGDLLVGSPCSMAPVDAAHAPLSERAEHLVSADLA